MAAGDRVIFYEKLGLVETSDIETYRRKLKIPKNINLETADLDEVLDSVEDKKPKKATAF